MRQALYRTYRPKTFDEIVGQDAVTEVLKNQIKSQAPAHAYLFSGTRGTGKTSCAKVLARAVNCLSPVNGNPCNQCENCRAILEETTMDIVEMDAASNRGIDDIRDLREKAIYLPGKLKYKVYIIDEAHMITKEGFNALLKTLEEPPAHLIFILATTEEEKIPETILSRCQRFTFLRIEEVQIVQHLKRIAEKIGVPYESLAIEYIARRSGGAMRDALSAMDQALSFGEITLKAVSEIYGGVEEETLFRLTEALHRKNGVEALRIFHDIVLSGKSLGTLLSDLMEHYRTLMIVKTGGELSEDYSPNRQEAYIRQSEILSLDSIFGALDELFQAEERLRWSEAQEIVVEMALLKILNQSSDKSILERIAALEEQGGKIIIPCNPEQESKDSPVIKELSNDSKLDKEKIPVKKKEEPKVPSLKEEKPNPPENIQKNPDETKERESAIKKDQDAAKISEEPVTTVQGPEENQNLEDMWNRMIKNLQQTDSSYASLLMFGEPESFEDYNMTVSFLPKHAFQRQFLENRERKPAVEAAASKALGRTVRFIFKERNDLGYMKDKLEHYFGDLLEINEEGGKE